MKKIEIVESLVGLVAKQHEHMDTLLKAMAKHIPVKADRDMFFDELLLATGDIKAACKRVVDGRRKEQVKADKVLDALVAEGPIEVCDSDAVLNAQRKVSEDRKREKYEEYLQDLIRLMDGCCYDTVFVKVNTLTALAIKELYALFPGLEALEATCRSLSVTAGNGFAALPKSDPIRVAEDKAFLAQVKLFKFNLSQLVSKDVSDRVEAMNDKGLFGGLAEAVSSGQAESNTNDLPADAQVPKATGPKPGSVVGKDEYLSKDMWVVDNYRLKPITAVLGPFWLSGSRKKGELSDHGKVFLRLEGVPSLAVAELTESEINHMRIVEEELKKIGK